MVVHAHRPGQRWIEGAGRRALGRPHAVASTVAKSRRRKAVKRTGRHWPQRTDWALSRRIRDAVWPLAAVPGRAA